MGEFKNADVAAKYEFIPKGDPVVHVPGGKAGNGWKGKLSTIPMDSADRLFEMKSNVLALKTTAEPKEALMPNVLIPSGKKKSSEKSDDEKTG